MVYEIEQNNYSRKRGNVYKIRYDSLGILKRMTFFDFLKSVLSAINKKNISEH